MTKATDAAMNLQVFTSNDQMKQRKRSFLYKCFKDYCDNTSLHGLKFITKDSSYMLERAFFVVCVFCALSGATFFLQPFFIKYFQSQILTTIESTGEPIWNIDFPAVTICNVNKASRSLVKDQARKTPWSNYTVEVLEAIVELMSQMGQIPIDKTITVNEEAKRAFNAHEAHIDALMMKVIQPVERMALRCWWIGELVNCSEILQLSRTDEGYCWGFNSEAMKALKPGELYREFEANFYEEYTAIGGDFDIDTDAEDDSYTERRTSGLIASQRSAYHLEQFKPKKVYGSGPNMGLTVLLNPDAHEYFANTNNLLGFKVLIHNPRDFPSVATKGFIANAGSEIFAAVSATKTLSTKEIRSIPTTKRNCLFENEKPLDFYTTFSYINCLMECKVESMRRTCNCAPYIYAHLRTIKICNYDGMRCINNHTRKFSSIQPNMRGKGIGNRIQAMIGCTCPSNCNQIIYIPEVTTAQFPMFPDDVLIPSSVKDVNKTKLSLLRVFFRDLSFVQYRRDLLYSWNDLIAAFGGVVGLFMGFSFISGLELIFFFTVRPLLRYSITAKKKTFVHTIGPSKK